MTKREYLNTLYYHLKYIPEQEKQDIVAEYDNHFIEGMRDGKTEEEIIATLGDPKAIAKELVADSTVSQVEETKSARNMLAAVLSVIGLSFLNLVIVLGPLLTVLGILLGIGIASIVMIGTPLILLWVHFFYDSIQLVTSDWYASFGYLGIGLMLYVLCFYLTKWTFILLVKYLKFNIKLVKRSANV
ncbi:hypothetical protein TP70_04345 [Staphylococcus microti]|uniref:Predicted membrane protein n=1 Tax=Staphylococcus microti TaxID=569857 RepID=A0A0D6XRV4_9STAP|nr:DUF1700 domain-containing protein [Staphylococcus microti]KIX91175.1 hypothetical protein TP70_04345 [Staphylococcus microti]PNZ75762.1 DUF1700 domain-containing protein [Staphylococcus microti]SUM58274.1 Predicted membrane protein [Staphylococcus microti]